MPLYIFSSVILHAEQTGLHYYRVCISHVSESLHRTNRAAYTAPVYLTLAILHTEQTGLHIPRLYISISDSPYRTNRAAYTAPVYLNQWFTIQNKHGCIKMTIPPWLLALLHTLAARFTQGYSISIISILSGSNVMDFMYISRSRVSPHRTNKAA